MLEEYGFLEESEKGAEINLGPLLDMVFILLIFFIITAQFSEQAGVEVNRPSASSARIISRKPVIIGLTFEDDIYIHGRKVSESSLSVILEREKMSDSEVTVLITGDRKSSLGALVRVMDICNVAGIEKVSLGAERK